MEYDSHPPVEALGIIESKIFSRAGRSLLVVVLWDLPSTPPRARAGSSPGTSSFCSFGRRFTPMAKGVGFGSRLEQRLDPARVFRASWAKPQMNTGPGFGADCWLTLFIHMHGELAFRVDEVLAPQEEKKERCVRKSSRLDKEPDYAHRETQFARRGQLLTHSSIQQQRRNSFVHGRVSKAQI